MVLDEQGWQELSKVLVDTLTTAMRIQQDSAKRLARTEDAPLRSELAVVHFQREG
jgi:hypothetical protein